MRTRILIIFALSGAAGLIDEIVWSRQLVLVFGNTTQAVSADPDGLLCRDGHRRADRRPDRRPGALAPAAIRVPGDRARRRRHRDATDVPPHQPGLSRDLPEPGGVAPGPRARPDGAGRPRPGPGHDHDGRDAPLLDPLPDAGRSPEQGVRQAVRRQHHRGDRRDPGSRLHPDRAARPHRGACGRRSVLGHRGCRCDPPGPPSSGGAARRRRGGRRGRRRGATDRGSGPARAR